MDVIAMISNLAGMAKEFLGFQSKKLDLKNTASAQAAATAQKEVDAQDKTAKAIANDDLDELRKEASE